MSSMRDRARQIKQDAEKHRGNYQPDPSSVPFRMYRYWAQQTGSAPARENFCHYWRVVVIWAPLAWLTAPVRRRFSTPTLLLAGVILAVIGLGLAMADSGFWGGLLVFYGIPYGAVGVASAMVRFTEDYEGHKTGWTRAFWLTLPVSGPVYSVMRFVEKFKRTTTAIAVTFGVALLTLMFVGLYLDFGWVGLLWPFAFVGAIAAISLAIAGLETLVSARRARIEEQREDWMEEMWESGTYVPEGERPWDRPGIVKRFFTGVGDFLVLAAQVVRVNKWKICPTVSIEPVYLGRRRSAMMEFIPTETSE